MTSARYDGDDSELARAASSAASHRARMSAPRDDEAVAVAAEDEARLTIGCATTARVGTELGRLNAEHVATALCGDVVVMRIFETGDIAAIWLDAPRVTALRDFLDRWLRLHGVRHISEDLSDDAASADRLESKTESHPHAAVDHGERADVQAIAGCDVCPHASVKFNGGRGAVICRRIAALPAEQRNAVGGSIVAEGFGATPPSFRPIACPLTHGQQHAPQTETAPVAPNGKAATECP